MFKIKTLAACVCIMGLSACTTTKKASSDISNAPVKALNLKNVKIPENLKDTGNPYTATQSTSCADMKMELTQLTEFLGPDWDSDDHYRKTGGKGGGFFDAILPYGGIVRFVSGASKHEKKVLEAADYAGVRRAHLKTLSASKGCSQAGY